MWTAIGLAAGLLFSLALGVWMPYAPNDIVAPSACVGNGFWCFAYTWQTLIAAIVAFLAAMRAWTVAKRQIRQSQYQFNVSEYNDLLRRQRSMRWLYETALEHLNKVRTNKDEVLASETFVALHDAFEGIKTRQFPTICERCGDFSLVVQMRMNDANHAGENLENISKAMSSRKKDERDIPSSFQETIREGLERRIHKLALLVNGLIDDIEDCERQLRAIELQDSSLQRH